MRLLAILLPLLADARRAPIAPRSRGRAVSWLVGVLVLVMAAHPAVARAGMADARGPGGAAVAAAAPLPVTVTQLSDTALTLDSNNPATDGPHAMYVAYRLTNTSGASAGNLSATISGFASGITLAGGQGATQYVGTLAAGASKTLYWFITYPSTFNVRIALTVTVSDGAGNSATGSGAVRTESMISAQAGGLTSASTIGAGAVVGQLIPLDVTFQFKGWKAGDSFNLQPAGNTAFPAGCFQLVSTSIVSADAGLASVTVPGTADKQYFVAGSASPGGGSTWNVQVRYTFKYLCANTTGSPLPYSNELSGTQLKYSANYGTGGGAPGTIPAAPSPSASFTIAKSASVSKLASGGSVTYTVTLTNISTFAVTVDSMIDALPTGATFGAIQAGSGVTAANSGSVPSAGASGTIVFRANPGTSYAVAAGAALTVVYSVTLAATAGAQVNTASAYIGTTSLGNASSTVYVGSADVSVAKTGPASVVTSDTIRYAIVVSNAGSAASLNVVVTDTLPSGVTYVSATNGGTYASGVVTWPAIASLASGSSQRDSVTVVAPGSLASLTNVAASTASTFDPTAGNNNGSAAGNRATTSVTVGVSVTPDGLAAPIKRLPGTTYSQLFTVANTSPLAGTYSLLAAAVGTPVVFAVDSITGAGITTRTRPDSVAVTLGARSTTSYTVWYTVTVGDTATTREQLRARNTALATLQDTGWVDIHRAEPAMRIAKAVSPTGTVLPGATLTYTVSFNNAGDWDAASVVVSDDVPAAVQLKVGSVTQSLTGGLTATVAYSADAGATWTYTPVTQGCGAPAGYDGCVTRIRWTLSAAMAPGATSSTVSFVARVR